MDACGVVTEMPPKKKSAGGRPPADEPMRSILSLKGTATFEAWLDGLVEATDLGTRTLALRHALKAYAEKVGYKKPMPKR
jgi:hypothetical protein